MTKDEWLKEYDAEYFDHDLEAIAESVLQDCDCSDLSDTAIELLRALDDFKGALNKAGFKGLR